MPAHLVAGVATRESCAPCAVVKVQCRGVVRVTVLPETDAISDSLAQAIVGRPLEDRRAVALVHLATCRSRR